jgi:phosphohistidine phosphatase SixA
VIYLVRHGHAGLRADWPEADSARPLSPRGRREAEAIAALLAPRGITRVLSSPHWRCRQTVAPLAAACLLEVEFEPLLAERAPLGAARPLLASAADGTVLCTHGNVISDLIAGLAADGAALQGPRNAEKGSIWELTAADGRVRSGRYLPPVD